MQKKIAEYEIWATQPILSNPNKCLKCDGNEQKEVSLENKDITGI